MKIVTFFSGHFERLEKRYGSGIGYFYALLATLLFVSANFFIKRLTNLSSSQILLYRALQHTLYSYYLMIQQDLPFHFKEVTVNRLLILRGFFGFFAISTHYYALTILPLSIATVAAEIQPIFVGIFAALILGESYEATQILTGMLCLVGVMFIAQPPFLFNSSDENPGMSSSDRIKGVTAEIISACFAALAQVMVRKVGAKSNLGIITLYFGVLATILSPVISFIQGIGVITIGNILPLFWLGSFSFFGQLCKNRAYLHGKAANISIIGYSGIAYTYFIDIFILGEEIDKYSVIGTAFVVLCLLISVMKSLRKS